MKTKYAMIGGSAALAVLLIIAGVIAAREYKGKPTYSALIVNAQQYAMNGNYDDAILEYKAAMELDETQEDAYVGLSIVYRSQNLMNLALETLRNGLEQCNSVTQLHAQLEQYFPEALEDSETMIGHDAQGEVSNASGAESWNAELLQFISSATYGAYQKQYSDLTSKMENGSCIVEISGIHASFVFYDSSSQRVVNATQQEPYEEFMPNEIVFDDLAALFGASTNMTYESLQATEDVMSLLQDDEKVEFELYGCWIVIPCAQDGTLDTTAPVTVYPMGADGSEGAYMLLGSVTDASDGSPVQSASIQFYAGSGTDETCYTATTDALGNYSVAVNESGSFTVVISKDGYQTATIETYVAGASDRAYRDFTISQERNQEIFIEFMDGARSHVDSRIDSTNIMYCLGTSGSNSCNAVVSSSGIYLLLAQWQLKDTEGNVLGTSEDLEWNWNLSVAGPVARPHGDGVMYHINGSFSRESCTLTNFAEGAVYVYNSELIGAGAASEYTGSDTALSVGKAELQFQYHGQMWTIDLSGEDVLFHANVCSAFGIATAKQSEQIEIDAIS